MSTGAGGPKRPGRGGAAPRSPASEGAGRTTRAPATGRAPAGARAPEAAAPPPGEIPLDPRSPAGGDREPSAREAQLLGADVLGRDDLSPSLFRELGDFVAERHVFLRMARPRPDRGREVRELAGLLRELGDGARAKRILEHLLRAERFFDIYPLELIARLAEVEPGYLPDVGLEPVVTNKRFLETRIFDVEDVIPLHLPLAARVRAFAVEGGATPGYCLSPGPPGRYELELASPGRFELLLGARLRGRDRVERVRLWVEDGPESEAGW